MNIYVAASWRTPLQPAVVAALRGAGHEVYDFRQDGFAWEEIDPDWKNWTPEQSRAALSAPPAIRGFTRDKGALDRCALNVLVLPCGRSAHLELGYTIGQGKPGIVFWPQDVHPYDPDLMYGLCDYFVTTFEELLIVVAREAAVHAS